jgi:hypothetical protein
VLGEIEERFASALDPLEKAFLLLGESTAYAIVGQLEDSRHSLGEARRIAPIDNHIFQFHADFGDCAPQKVRMHMKRCNFPRSIRSGRRTGREYQTHCVCGWRRINRNFIRSSSTPGIGLV